MANPTDPACGRPTKAGTPCRHSRGSAYGLREVWESPACQAHLTPEERAARETAEQAVEARLRAARAAIEPACWSWTLPTPEDLSAFDTFDGWGALVGVTDDEADFLRSLRPSPDSVAFNVFHDGRCAICGVTSDRRLVNDHDHLTGMIRGKLCRGCNTTEGFSRYPVFQKYRERNPASILGVRLPYTGIGWEDGVPVGGWERQPRRGPQDIDSIWVDNAAAQLGL